MKYIIYVLFSVQLYVKKDQKGTFSHCVSFMSQRHNIYGVGAVCADVLVLALYNTVL